ncbi:MAG: GNAT family N-acetyltransferase [Spirochaetes bacterium]|nr:GNAT family N-acetyltransferase [Spirochaetota bacterium]
MERSIRKDANPLDSTLRAEPSFRGEIRMKLGLGGNRMGIEYRKLVIADYDELITLWSDMPGIGISAADERDRLEAFLEVNGEACFVAVDGGKIVGTALCGNDRRRGFLYHLAVLENHRSKGIGSALVGLCMKELTRSGIEKCHLFVLDSNVEAIGYYRRSGWTERTDLRLFSRAT